MTNEKAIERIKAFSIFLTGGNPIWDVDECREAFDIALAAMGQKWIPVSERMPSENGDYLVTLENGVVKILGYSTTQRTTYPKGFYHIKDGFSWRQVQNPVVAWMPLPKPWRGEEDE